MCIEIAPLIKSFKKFYRRGTKISLFITSVTKIYSYINKINFSGRNIRESDGTERFQNRKFHKQSF